MSRSNGGIIGSISSIDLTGATGLFGINESYRARLENKWPIVQPLYADLLVVAGGGGGGGGGGGAGGLISQTTVLLTKGAIYTVEVGAGGPGQTNGSAYGTNGNDSSLVGIDLSILTTGGGRGAGPYTGQTAGSGGSGGGGADSAPTAGSGIEGQGYAGADWTYNGGNAHSAGGGAGGVGSRQGPNQRFGGTGGLGFQWVDGNYYASGGAGGATTSDFVGYAPPGGGGGSDAYGDSGTSSQISHPGDPNTGGGGSGRRASNLGGAGGSGVVILRIADTFSTNTTGSPTVSTANGYSDYIFTVSGTITILG